MKNDPSKLPPKLDASPFRNVYKYELLRLASNIAEKAEAVFAMTSIPEPPLISMSGGYQVVHSTIAALLSDAASAKNLLEDYRRGRRESPAALSIRKQRTQALLLELEGIEISVLLDKKVRNSLEHFDEYLDDANAQFSSGHTLYRFGLYNMVLSRRNAFAQPNQLYPIRVYIVDERVYENFGTSIDIGRLYDEAVLIRDRLRERLQIGRDWNGGMAFPIGAAS